MSKRQVLILLGVLTIVFTFLGFPWDIKQILIIVAGGLVGVIAYSMAAKSPVLRIGDTPFTEYKSQPKETDTIINQKLPDHK